MKEKKACDFTLMISVLLLTFIGIIMVFSSSWPDGLYKMDSGFHFVKKQFISALIGLGAMLFLMNYNYRKLYKYSRLIFILAVFTGLLILTPLGKEVNGARRWVNLGIGQFMPSDIIKLSSVIFFSAFLVKRQDRIKQFKSGFLASMGVIAGTCALIIVQKDLGTTGTLSITLVVMLFVAGVKKSYLTLVGLAGSGLLALAVFQPFTDAAKRYRMRRVTTFIDPFADKAGAGFQVVQSLYALGSGGLFGLGLGKSRQKYFYLPEPYNDFIFAIIGEELGFVGCTTVILLYTILIWRGIKVALNARDLFGCMLAVGITTMISVQTLIHIAVVTSSMPTTGITLPFISFGGTSLIMYMSMAGILLNISRYTE